MIERRLVSMEIKVLKYIFFSCSGVYSQLCFSSCFLNCNPHFHFLLLLFRIPFIFFFIFIFSELKTLEWWISRLMRDSLFFIISRLI